MPDVALRGIPENLHRELKSAASRNHRSLNGEILARLTASVRGTTADTAELLERIRARRETFGEIDVSVETIKELKNAGRP